MGRTFPDPNSLPLEGPTDGKHSQLNFHQELPANFLKPPNWIISKAILSTTVHPAVVNGVKCPQKEIVFQSYLIRNEAHGALEASGQQKETTFEHDWNRTHANYLDRKHHATK